MEPIFEWKGWIVGHTPSKERILTREILNTINKAQIFQDISISTITVSPTALNDHQWPIPNAQNKDVSQTIPHRLPRSPIPYRSGKHHLRNQWCQSRHKRCHRQHQRSERNGLGLSSKKQPGQPLHYICISWQFCCRFLWWFQHIYAVWYHGTACPGYSKCLLE